MGCGESKHAVATADTISQTKRSNSKKTNGPENPTLIEKATDDLKTNTNASLEEQEKGANLIVNEGHENVKKDSESAIVKESENPKADDVKESDRQENGETVVETVKENENKEAEVAAEDAKEESEKKELKEESSEKKEEEAGGAGPDSPHHFFSPKKGEDTIESIISDGVSGNSEYNTPRAKRAPSEHKTDANDAVEEKGSTTETKSEETLTENEGKQTIEGEEAVQTAETKEKKAPGDKEDNATESSAKDPKTT